MKKSVFLVSMVLAGGMLLAGCKKQAAQELVVLAAASLTDVLSELGAQYEAETGTKVLFSYASSGTLQAQIAEGAQADIFISAALTQMDALVSAQLVDSESVVRLLKNKIVLITNAQHPAPISSFEAVLSPAVTLIGLGDPAHVPVGQYAESLFSALGIVDAVRHKANYGSDVRTVLSWVEQDAVDVGIVYATDAALSSAVTVLAELSDGIVQDVVYPAGIIAQSAHKTESARFLAFLQEEPARAVFARYGFTPLAD